MTGLYIHFLIGSFILSYVSNITRADNLKTYSVLENRTKEVLETWTKMDKKLKHSAQSLVKMMMPTILKTTNELNLTSECTKESFQLIMGLRNLKKWAVGFLDSSAIPMGGVLRGTVSFLGVYDECLETEVPHPKRKDEVMFRGQYCMADIKPPLPPKTRKYLVHDHLDELRNFSGSDVALFLANQAHIFYYMPIKMGICIPSGCTAHDLEQLLNAVIQDFHFTAEVSHCEVKEKVKINNVHIVAMIVTCILVCCVLIGTCFEMSSSSGKTENTCHKFFLCFSMVRGFRRIFSTKVPPNIVHSLHGLRSLSIIWSVMGHAYFYPGYHSIFYQRLTDVIDIVREPMAQTIINSSLVIDTFFFMSGLLVCYITVRNDKLQEKKFDLKCFIFRRFLRICPSYYFILLIAMLVPLMCSGPLAYIWMDSFFYPCYQHWWRNLLFINNFYSLTNTCMMHTWYVACDMQLYIASLIVLLPLLRSEKIGIIINIMVIVISIIYSGIIPYLADSGIGILPNYIDPMDQNSGFLYLYANALSHAGPYFLGMLVGYVLITRPNMKIPKVVLVFGWFFAILSSASILYTTAFWYHIRDATPLETFIYSAFQKTAFIAGIAWMTFCCATGYGGFINDILSWKAWIPISRLTFFIYLTETIFQIAYISVFKTTQEYTHLHFIVEFFGFFCISSLLAFLCTLLVESPFMALENLILFRAPKKNPDAKGIDNDALEINVFKVEKDGYPDQKMRNEL